jgi:hypothetical protein
MGKHILLLLILITGIANAQQPTVGLVQYNVPNTDGYILYAPMGSFTTYLIDKCGREINQWESTYRPGLSAYLMPDGSLYRSGNTGNTVFGSGGSGGIVEKYDWAGNLAWSYRLSDSTQCQHHDFTVLPNGNVLFITWELHDTIDAVANGRNPNQLGTEFWSEKLIEVQPIGADQGNIVWEWDVWDHLVQEFDNTKQNYATVSQHPELININFIGSAPTNADWIHLNSVQYNADLDQLLLSSHSFSELWIIDHSTTTQQAASHSGGNNNKGGDLLYRWGNPRTYGRGTVADRKFFAQHHATWVPQGFPNAGNLMVFNNGFNRPGGNYSSVDMIAPPLQQDNSYLINGNNDYGPDTLFWTYEDPTPADFYAVNISGAYALPNGSFLISNGPSGYFFEVDANKNTVWKYISPIVGGNPVAQGTAPGNNQLFRANYYPLDYFTFNPDLSPGVEVELNPSSPSICEQLGVGVEEVMNDAAISIYPNPADDVLYINSTTAISSFQLYNGVGQLCYAATNSNAINVAGLPGGLYVLRVMAGTYSYTQKVLIK